MFRFLWASAVTVGMFGALASAAPTTRPVIQPEKVAVLPFTVVAPDRSSDWIAPAVRENLLGDLARVPTIEVLSAVSMQAAKSQGARCVIRETVQVVDADVRITGQLFDGHTSKALGSLKATGTVHDLFTIEDVITAQAKRLLPRPAANVAHEQEINRAVAVARTPSGPLTITRSYQPSIRQTLQQKPPISGDYRGGVQRYYYGQTIIPRHGCVSYWGAYRYKGYYGRWIHP